MDISKYRKALEEERNHLIEDMKNNGGFQNPDNLDDWEARGNLLNYGNEADEGIVADSIEELEINSAIVNQLEVRLHEVNDALEKIEKGTFGMCEKTGERIPENRLDANPAARTIIEEA